MKKKIKINKTILVTGAGGYIGSVLVPELLKKNYSVLALDKFFFGNTIKSHKNLKKIKIDCRNINVKYFKDLHAVIDLVGISNDASGERFKSITWEVNFRSRLNTAKLAKKYNVKRYILPSSCSIYGFQKKIVTENSRVNPLTTYAKSNFKAENEIRKLSDKNFCVTIVRQATIFGLSPRMRFDLAVNGMTEGAYRTLKLPLMRDGNQIRPLCHVKDTCRLQIQLLETDEKKINNQIFNVGSKKCTKKILDFAKIVSSCFKKKPKIEWYGDPDHRSYNVSFEKLKKLNFKTKFDIKIGVKEILKKLKQKKLKKTNKSITLEWYKHLQNKGIFLKSDKS